MVPYCVVIPQKNITEEPRFITHFLQTDSAEFLTFETYQISRGVDLKPDIRNQKVNASVLTIVTRSVIVAIIFKCVFNTF
jgi:hypothetical protein